MTTSEPLVTINILSYNRKDELQHTLTKVYEQDYKNIEVVVVDNASNDGSPEMVKNNFPKVQQIQLEKNIGIAGWNEGFKVAKGEYVLVLDDDSYPDTNCIKKGVSLLNNKENVGVVAFNIIDQKRHLSETALYKAPFLEFIGCGAMIRRNLFINLKGFDKLFFIYCHEQDFSIRVLNAGFEIDYIDDAIIYHRSLNFTEEHPINNSFRYYYLTKSYIHLIRKYLDKRKYYKVIFKLLVNRLLIAIYFGRLKEYISIITYLLFNRYAFNNQVKISKDVLELYNLNIAIFDRSFFSGLIKNHYKILFPFLYLSSIFYPINRKNLFIE